MTLIEKKSKRKATAIKTLVDNGEYSPSYALMIAEELNDSGKLLDIDYEPLAEWLESLIEEDVSGIEEIPEENKGNYDENQESAE